VWPNRSFAESLREAIGDSGPVLTWSHFEGTTIRQIMPELLRFGHDVPELVAWMTDVVENRIVDLHDWALHDYYNPGMRGRTGIKVVLDALWKSDALMRKQFEAWTGMVADETRDPYAFLPPVEISGVLQDVHEGTVPILHYQDAVVCPVKLTNKLTTSVVRRCRTFPSFKSSSAERNAHHLHRYRSVRHAL